MESSSKKSGGGVIPRKKRSLDINSLYEPRAPVVGEVKRRDSEKKDHVEDVETRRKKSRKEVSLSSFQSEEGKRKEEDVSGEKSETGAVQNLSGANSGLHGMLPGLAGNASVFNIPKGPRGPVRRRRKIPDHRPKQVRLQDPQLPNPIQLQDPQIPKPLRLHDLNDCVDVGNVDVTKPKIGRGVKDKLGKASSVSAAKGGTSKPNSPGLEGLKKLESKLLSKSSVHQGSVDSMVPVNVNHSKPKAVPCSTELDKIAISAGGSDVKGPYSLVKNKQPNSKSKQKAELKSSFDASSSSQNLKQKADLKSTVDSSSSNQNLKQDEYVKLTIADPSRPNQIVKQKKVSKPKNILKPTIDANSPKKTLKRKAGGDETKDHKNSKSGLVEKEEDVLVSSGNRSPKRQRGSSSQKKDLLVRRDVKEASAKKTATSVVCEVEESRNGKTGVAGGKDIQVVNNDNSAPLKRQRKSKKKDIAGARDVKETSNKRTETSVAEVVENKNDRLVAVGEEDILAVVNGHISSIKQPSGSMKQNDLFVDQVGEDDSTKKTGPSVDPPASDSLFVDFLDDDDDDEENLERNAARMLSSRFDPSCTGFPSKKRISKPEMVDVFSVPVSSGQDFGNQQANTSVFQEPGSADAMNIALRPRGDDKGKPVQRKRRHFYEVLPQDFDALWVVNRRIKIFWPLDESWYHGLVKGYHPEVKLHHIKYDDRDEEWVDLQEETFKLLLLPNEVPGKVKGRKRKARSKDAREVRTTPRSDDDNHRGNELDSELISSWLARSNQRALSKKSGTSPMNLPTVSSLSAERTENSHSLGSMSDSVTAINKQDFESALTNGFDDEEGFIESMLGALGRSGNDTQIVYVRKKNKGRSPAPIDVNNACGHFSSLAHVDGFDSECVDSERQLWLIDGDGKLQLNIMLVSSAECRFQTCPAAMSFLECSHEADDFWLLHCIFMLQHGTLVTTSPVVKLEMLFVDSNNGLRFLLFEGCLKQALALFFLILAVFSKSDEQCNHDTSVPVTSIRFRILGGQDLRLQHAFSLYSFSGLKRYKWLFLDLKLLQHCALLKQLPISECTHDNIKDLECGNLAHQCGSDNGSEISTYKDNRRSTTGILPMGISRESCNSRMSLSTSSPVTKHREGPQFALCFGTAQTFLLSLQLRSLMEHSSASIDLQDNDAMCSTDHSERAADPVGETHACTGPASGDADHIAPDEQNCSSERGGLETDLVLGSNSTVNTSLNLQDGIPEVFVSENNLEVSTQLEHDESIKDINGHDVASSLQDAPTGTDLTSNPRCDLKSSSLVVDVSLSDMPLDGKGRTSRQTPGGDGSVKYGFLNSPSLGSRSPSKRRISSSISSRGDLSPVWSDGKTNHARNAFSNGPKKPRTQVRYTMPSAGYDDGAKQKLQSQRALPCKRIRRASLKKLSDVSREDVVKDTSKSIQKKPETLSCGANVLVTQGDKGWRLCGATVVLEVSDRNEWRLAVKLSGITKYSYKVNQILQPGSTNRFSHAMMWKGGKDWVLEFPDRSQWTLFKEMHEECHNRNIRAASVKNIPIPGVRLVEESDDWCEIPFVPNSMKYYRQVQTDVEMALDPSRVLYDMDSDDEHWLLENNRCRDEELSEEALEKTIDMFEKVSCLQQRDKFTDAEIEEIMVGVGSVEATKLIYGHWRHKREKKGMPLIRHLQPPLWERYQQQLKEWERTVGRSNGASSNASQGKPSPREKPTMFAFCMKPRGLEVPNRGSKQRSQRKFLVSGHHHASSRDPEGVVYGRRAHVHTFRDDKALYPLNEYSDVSPSFRASTRGFSPLDAHFSLNSDGSEWNRNPNIYKNRPKKLKSFAYLNSQHMLRPFNQRTAARTAHLHEMSGQRQAYLGGNQSREMEKLSDSDLHEFRLRDASSASQHAHNMAKLKRERAQRLLYRADLCIHKAVTAIMTAEAMKAAHWGSNAEN